MKRMIKQVMLFSDNEENPCFGETTTHVGIDDKAGGMFITVRQCADGDVCTLKVLRDALNKLDSGNGE